MKKSTPFWCEDCRFVCFETRLGKPILTLNDPKGFKNATNVYSIHLELRMALSCQISAGKWKYVNPCLDFLGISYQRTAYVKRQVRPGRTYVRWSSVTPDLLITALLSSVWRYNDVQCGISADMIRWNIQISSSLRRNLLNWRCGFCGTTWFNYQPMALTQIITVTSN